MNSIIHLTSQKSLDSITSEWDAIAPERDRLITTNRDDSFTKVLKPWILKRLQGAARIVDVGCGTGRLTANLAEQSEFTLGLDPSSVSIKIARGHDGVSEYKVSTAEEWIKHNPDASFDLVVANMVLMDAVDLKGLCQAIAKMGDGVRVLATITHPAFWPEYWGYASESGFDYLSETYIEGPFRTSSHEFSKVSTHIHRPVSRYLSEFRSSGLEIVRVDELRGPEGREVFRFPRFLAFELRNGE
ncbi:bifunctional 2-polyprenyl-6-hydroxyphenol methylase/3-demethylubiquinol 3-O-methyltransferase UbiG [Gordonia sp. OPL2]|uniref:class I SAM-dependent methyltransferase n=1 Tax=Gordonia sp. OPL2 TaxID=2486274 RepID=UPI001655A8EB|nr:class I SAM-dependent methyltransferase [Gordonia sp. OPL2]